MFQLISPPPNTDTAQGEAEKIVGVLLRRGRARQLQMVKANCCTCDENLLLSSTHSLQEGNEGHEAFIVGGLAELLHQDLASSLVSFSPRLVSILNSSWASMVLSSFLSYSFRISTKSWKPPWSLESLQALYMGNTSALVSIFCPFSAVPPISAMVFRVGLRLQARMRSPA